MTDNALSEELKLIEDIDDLSSEILDELSNGKGEEEDE